MSLLVPVNQCSSAVTQLPKGCASQVCQKLGLCLLALWFLSLLSSGGVFYPDQISTKTSSYWAVQVPEHIHRSFGWCFDWETGDMPPTHL